MNKKNTGSGGDLRGAKRLAVALVALVLLGAVFGLALYQTTNDTGYETAEEMTTQPTTAVQPVDWPQTQTKVLYNRDGISVVARPMENALGNQCAIPVTIKNESEERAIVGTAQLSVNGYMMDESGLSTGIQPGETWDDYIYLYQDELDLAGIGTVADVEFRLEILNGEYERTHLSEVISIQTDAAEGYTESVDDSGMVLCELNGLRVVYQGYRLDEGTGYGYLMFYIENNTDRYVEVAGQELLVNGVAMDGLLRDELRAGTRAVSGLEIYGAADRGLTGEEALQTLGLRFYASDLDSGELIMESPAISLELY